MKSSIDIWFVICLVLLLLFSLFNMLGIKLDYAYQHALGIGIGLVFFILAYKITIKPIHSNWKIIYLGFFALLILTSIVGIQVKGAQRWLSILGFGFQPSELFKPFFIIILAHLLSNIKTYSVFNVLRVAFVSMLPIILIYQQPDLGNAILYFGVFICVFFLAGLPIIWYAMSSIIFFIMSPLLWNLLKTYQKDRIYTFLNRQLDPLGITYNINQAIITVGSGGMWGKGLGLGTQSRFRFLPENQTDFIFSSFIEQFGFIGGVVLLCLFAFLLYRLYLNGIYKNKDLFSKLYVAGVMLFITLSIVVNVGMNMGIVPVAGITLPLFSYGSSSLISFMIMLGFAASL